MSSCRLVNISIEASLKYTKDMASTTLQKQEDMHTISYSNAIGTLKSL